MSPSTRSIDFELTCCHRTDETCAAAWPSTHRSENEGGQIVTRLHYTIDIDAPRERVWAVLWDDKTYRDWSSAFMEGSHLAGELKEGNKVQFLDPSGSGMASIVEKKVPNERMTFRHVGEIKDGKEHPARPSWANAHEEYVLRDNGRGTTLTVDADSADEYKEMFEKAFPKALQRLKELATQQPTGATR
jgi:uncharacterized protein YndB with AHSA1/START domain